MCFRCYSAKRQRDTNRVLANSHFYRLIVNFSISVEAPRCNEFQRVSAVFISVCPIELWGIATEQQLVVHSNLTH